MLRLLDTPGFEDSIALLQCIEDEDDSGRRLGIDQLEAFLQTSMARGTFAQEAKVIRQLLECHLIIYVIDAREPVLGKYQDELRILSLSAKPVIPLLNFVADANNQEAQWRSLLAKLNLHTVIAFDSVAYDFNGEQMLYLKMQTMMDAWRLPLEVLIEDRRRAWQSLLASAAKQVATLLVNAAAYRQPVHGDDQREVLIEKLQSAIRQQEQQTARQLLQLFQFRPDDYGAELLPVAGGDWQLDLFDPESLKLFGIRAGSAAAKGAALGLGVDIAVGGISLGAAAALGALLGGAWQAGRQFGRDALGYLKGQRYLCVEQETLQLIWQRCSLLVSVLRHRGHAAQGTIELTGAEFDDRQEVILHTVKVAKNHPDWALTPNSLATDSTSRQRHIEALAASILQAWHA